MKFPEAMRCKMIQDVQRKITELSFESAKFHQSEETRFIHYNYAAKESEKADAIPVYENFLLALALFRSCKSDYITEAKILLEKLLYYQNNGNFPIYLHEAPFCYNRFQGVKILTPLYWIYHQFHHILGAQLRAQSLVCLESLCRYSLTVLQENPADYGITLEIAAGAVAVGGLLSNPELEETGAQMMNDLLQMGPQPIWYSTEGIASILVSLQMVYQNISQSSWKIFWSHIEKTWHPTLQSYVGPFFNEMQRGFGSKISLYDYFLAAFSGSLPSSLCEKQFDQLYAILVRPEEGKFFSSEEIERYEIIGSTEWFIKISPKYAYSLIKQHDKKDAGHQKGFHPFYLQWKNNEMDYSIACAGGRFSSMTYTINDDTLLLYFNLPDPMENDHALENRELLFYCTSHPGLKIAVEGERATTFKMGEIIQIDAGCQIKMKFELEKGEGGFLGHLMPGNRPSQLLAFKGVLGQAYDRQIFLRTLRKKESCTICVSIKLEF